MEKNIFSKLLAGCIVIGWVLFDLHVDHEINPTVEMLIVVYVLSLVLGANIGKVLLFMERRR